MRIFGIDVADSDMLGSGKIPGPTGGGINLHTSGKAKLKVGIWVLANIFQPRSILSASSFMVSLAEA